MKQNHTKPIKTIALFLFALLIVVPHIVSAESYKGLHRGVRPLGMGGAFTAVANDHNSIFYNPAGLAQANSFGFGLLNPFVSVSENTIDLIKDYGDIDTDNTVEVTELMRNYIGENNNLKIMLNPYTGFNVKDFGVMISIIGQSDTDISIHNPVWPEARIRSTADYGAIIGAGTAIPLVKGLKVGAAIKFIERESLDQVYTALDIANSDDFADLIEDDTESGTGVSMDIGVIYSISDIPFTDLDIAFAGLNIPEMDFGDAAESKTQYNVGVAFKQKFGILQLTEAVDYMDITDNLTDDDSLEKKLHLGIEAKLPIISLRAGLNQGYYTLGTTLNFGVIRFDVASFGEEVGVYGGQKEDRQLAAQISIGWDW